MRHHTAVVLAVAFRALLPGPANLSAQQVSSFEQLQLLVSPGDKVEVIATDGTASVGKIESLSPASLRLATKGKIREYAQRDAIEIRQKRGDSLKNGALIGAAIGGGLVGLIAIGGCRNGGCRGDGGFLVGAAIFDAGIGAAIGVGIDAMFTHRQTIYRTSAQAAISRVRVVPLIASKGKGVALRYSF